MTLTFRQVLEPEPQTRRPPMRQLTQRASVAGIPPRRYTAEEDAAIVAQWSIGPLRELAARLGRGEHAVQSRARRLVAHGRLALRERFVPPPWTPEEIEVLQGQRGYLSDLDLAQKLGRTPTAIVLKGKRLSATQKANWLTARQVAQIMGVESKKPKRWADQGLLKLPRSVVSVGPHRVWRCEIAELERFLARHPAHYDWRRIADEPWRQMGRTATEKAGWLSVEEAARLRGVTENCLTRHIRLGRLPAVVTHNHGGSGAYRVRRVDVERWEPLRPELVGHRGRGR